MFKNFTRLFQNMMDMEAINEKRRERMLKRIEYLEKEMSSVTSEVIAMGAEKLREDKS